MLAVHLELPQRSSGCSPARKINRRTVGHRWPTIVSRPGVRAFRLHDLRQFFPSGLIAAGCDVVTVPSTRTRQGLNHSGDLLAPLALGCGQDPSSSGALVDEVQQNSAESVRTGDPN